jgi:O-antigen ligase
MMSRILDLSLFGLALMIPFSIAGMNAAILLGLIVWFVLSLRRVPGDGSLGRALQDPIVIAALLLALSAVPSVLMSENIDRAFLDWKSYWLIAAYALAATHIRTSGRRLAIYWTLFGSVMLTCGVALIQHFGGIDFLFIHIAHERRPSSTLYPMTLAGLLYQMILLNFSVFAGRRRSWPTVLLAAGILVQLAVLLLTLTRGAYLALFGGLAVSLILLRNKKALLASAAIVGLSVLFLTIKPADLDRPLSVPSLFKAAPDRNVGTRLVLWNISLELFKDHPLFGVGMGDYSTEADRLIRERRIKTNVDSHNIYLQLLATRGLFGIFFFGLFWWVVLRELFRLKNRLPAGSFERYLAVGAIAATAALLFGALTENNIDDCEVYIAFLFVLGLARSAVGPASPAAPTAQDRRGHRA